MHFPKRFAVNIYLQTLPLMFEVLEPVSIVSHSAGDLEGCVHPIRTQSKKTVVHKDRSIKNYRPHHLRPLNTG